MDVSHLKVKKIFSFEPWVHCFCSESTKMFDPSNVRFVTTVRSRQKVNSTLTFYTVTSASSCPSVNFNNLFFNDYSKKLDLFTIEIIFIIFAKRL